MSLIRLLTAEGLHDTDETDLDDQPIFGKIHAMGTGQPVEYEATGRFSRPCFHFEHDDASMGISVAGDGGAAITEVIVEFAAKLNSSLNSWTMLLGYSSPTAHHLGMLWDYRSNSIDFQRFTTRVSSNTLASGLPIYRGVWHHFGVRVLFDQTVGEIEFKLDGRTIFDVGSLDTMNSATAGCSMLWFGQQFGGPYNGISDWQLADIVIKDPGGSKLNGLEGDRSIIVLNPTSDTADEDLTLSAGVDSFAVVDETPADIDTDYMESATATERTRLGFENLPAAVSAVDAVQLAVVARKTEVTDLGLDIVAEHSASESQGSKRHLGPDGTWHMEIFEDVPGGSDWTPGQVDAMTGGVEVAS